MRLEVRIILSWMEEIETSLSNLESANDRYRKTMLQVNNIVRLMMILMNFKDCYRY